MGKFVIAAAASVALLGGVFYFRDTTGPEVTLSPSKGAVSSKTNFEIHAVDSASGLRQLRVQVLQNAKQVTVLELALEEGTMEAREEFVLDRNLVSDGPLEIRVLAADRSIYHFGAGNESLLSRNLTLDTTAPKIFPKSTTHNLNVGGAGLAVYKVSESDVVTGIQIGDFFYPGYLQPSGDYAALFSYPHDMPAQEFIPKIYAEDAAGNSSLAGIYFHTNAKKFKQDRINISDQFLDAKMPQFAELFPAAGTNLEIFLKVNQELRMENRRQLLEIGRLTATEPLWEGSFVRQPQSATRSTFGDRRTYYYQGREVDRQTHLGIDLASVKHDPIQSVNNGKVVFADFFGIYGLCVIVDHGLGLQSLYSHLSQIDVSVGSKVQKGDVIGLSGMTGMAGGDHLHLGILISGIPSNPVEWWDEQWMKNNILSKLRP